LKNPSILTHGTALYSSSTPKQFESVVSKYYNLEEKEDNENSTTEIFLLADGTVSLGETDAPLTVKATGTWSQNGGEFEMHIKRTFGAGQDHTDVGEFQFVVERGFVGQLETVGALLSVGGSMHLKVCCISENESLCCTFSEYAWTHIMLDNVLLIYSIG